MRTEVQGDPVGAPELCETEPVDTFGEPTLDKEPVERIKYVYVHTDEDPRMT